MARTTLTKMLFPTLPLGSLCPTTMTSPTVSARPAAARGGSRTIAIRKTAGKPARNGTSRWTRLPSPKEPTAKASPTAAGAANGNRRRANSGTMIATTPRMSNQRGPPGPSFSPWRTVTSARATPSPARRAASNQ